MPLLITSKVNILKKGLTLLTEIDKVNSSLNMLNNLTEEEAGQLSNLLDKIR